MRKMEGVFRHTKSATFWRIFLLYAMPAVILLFGFFLFEYNRSVNENRDRMNRQNVAAIDAVMSRLDGLLADELVKSQNINDIYWVQQLYLRDSLFEDPSYTERLKLSEEHLLRTNDYSDEKLIFLVFPKRNLCVANRIWVSVKDYLSMQRLTLDEQADFMSCLKSAKGMTVMPVFSGTSFENTLTLCVPLENLREPRGYAVYGIKKSRLEADLADMMSDGLMSVRIIDNETGESLLTVEGDGGSEETVSVSMGSDYMNWRCEFLIDESRYTVTYSSTNPNMLMYMFALLLALLAVFYGIALYSYRPIGKLVSAVGGGLVPQSRKRDDYHFISQSIERLRVQMEEEKRGGAIRKLLLGCFEQDEIIVASSGLPFREDMYFQVLFDDDQRKSSTLQKALALSERFPQMLCECVDAGEYQLIILGYRSEEESMRGRDAVEAFMRERGEEVTVTLGRKGLIGISTAYQSGVIGHHLQQGDNCVQYYFPLAWENQLTAAIRTGNAAVAKSILTELRRENAGRVEREAMTTEDIFALQRVIIGDIQRVALEAGMAQDMLHLPKDMLLNRQTDEIWGEIERLNGVVCVFTKPRTVPEDDLAHKVIRYIDEHFQQSDLSLNTLEEHFNVSSATINKCVKTAVNSTFLVYLTHKRLEYARCLLLEGQCSIAEVAQLSGYENESSFRRMFFRTVGIKAQDYAGSMMTVDEVNSGQGTA